MDNLQAARNTTDNANVETLSFCMPSRSPENAVAGVFLSLTGSDTTHLLVFRLSLRANLVRQSWPKPQTRPGSCCQESCDKMEAQGVQFKKRPQDGNMRGIAFAYDPNGYWVELVDRKASFSGICSNY